jgi:hypothetical protein
MARQKSNNISTLYDELGFGGEDQNRQFNVIKEVMKNFWKEFCLEKNVPFTHVATFQEVNDFAEEFCEKYGRGYNYWPIGGDHPSWETEKELYVRSFLLTITSS